MMNTKIGFARVSTISQSLDEQIRILTNYGCKKIFANKNSGNELENKKSLDELLNYIREGDTVVVTKLDRLGRSLGQVLTVLDVLQKMGVGFIAIEQGINTLKKNDPISKAMIHFLGLFAELERNFIIERTKGGKLAKIQSGDTNAIGGRPKKVTDEIKNAIIKDLNKPLKIIEITQKYKLSRTTIWRIKKSYNVT